MAAPLPFKPYQLTLRIKTSQSLDGLNDPHDRYVQSWHVDYGIQDDSEEIVTKVGTAEIWIVDFNAALAYGHHPHLLLDSWSKDLADVAETLFDPETGEFNVYDDTTPYPGGSVLIIDQLWVDPLYRGHRLGAFMAGMAIAALERGCTIAAVDPTPTEGLNTDEARDVGRRALGRMWATLGFRPHRGGVLVLDLGMTTWEQAVKDLFAAAHQR